MQKNLNLGITSFYASLHKVDECESNGLPRLPYSVNIIGRFEELKSLDHPNLCQYLDAKRDKHEQIVIATEYFSSNLNTNPPDIKQLGKNKCVEILYRLTSAIEYLHNSGILVRNIATRNIFWTNDENIIKLSNHGLYFMTDGGLEVDFMIGHVPYLAPECVLDLFHRENSRLTTYRSDVWSIGMIILQMLCNGSLPDKFGDLQSSASFILDCYVSNKDFLSELHLNDSTMDSELLCLARKCLQLQIIDRISVAKLKQELLRLSSGIVTSRFNGNGLPEFDNLMSGFGENNDGEVWHFHDARERYFFWTLTGGDLWKYQSDDWDSQKKIPSILTLPILIKRDGDEFWTSSIAQCVKQVFCDTIYPLSTNKLLERLSKIPRSVFSEPQLKLPNEFKPFDFSSLELEKSSDADELQIRSQPVSVKEKDFEYQLRRVIRFKRLLNGYPLTRQALLKEASYDIPPLLRSKIWPLLLDIDPIDAAKRYARVQGTSLEDKAAGQIMVDLPRCHSYDEFIVSNSGQGKLSRILHSWLLHHSYLEYTQGMDSLCAVFVRLLFNQEHIAFACLEAFVDKFMCGLFCVSHGQALNEYCNVLQKLLAFHKPHLSQAINIFSITGFTASWIYTGFAHSLSLDKTLRLWDTVIIGDPSFPMMIFIALLGQLDQESAFSSQATEHVFSVLSNLQEFDLDQCKLEAIDLARKTPPSITYRQIGSDPSIVGKSIDVQNNCVSPRISLDDLLVLLGEFDVVNGKGLHSPFSFRRDRSRPPLLIDLRMRDKYQRGNLSGSVNFPIVSASPHTTFAELESQNAHTIIGEAECNIKVIIGTVDDNVCEMVAKIFVNSYHFPYVCILKGGINAVHDRRPDLLVVTS